jgi:hypothetical protein
MKVRRGGKGRMTYLKELMKEKTPKMSSKISIPGKRYL